MRLSASSGVALLLALAPGCASVGSACDPVAAQEIVYNASTGAPAFAGQAMMITSCAGGGSFCHSDIAERRFGAPDGMNFDPTLANATRFDGPRSTSGPGVQHLLSSRVAMIHYRDAIYGEVLWGSMPPGELGAAVERRPYRRYTDDTDLVGTPLPSITSAEGHEILRNWLACGVPVVERTEAPATSHCTTDADCPLTRCSAVPGADGLRECELVGFIVPRRPVTTMPTWGSIYETVIADGCAISQCHDAAGAPNAGGLDMHTQAIAYDALVHQSPGFPSCAGDPTNPTRLVPGDPDTSFFLHKLDGSPLDADCGVSMPIGGENLTDDQIAAIREWIMMGAPETP